MNITQTISPAAWTMHGGGWWILGAVVMMGFMGAMMWMMMRGMGGSSSKRSSAPSESPPTTESPVEILERRFAEGEISVEDYRQRREALAAAADRGQVGGGNGKPASGNGKPVAAATASREEEP